MSIEKTLRRLETTHRSWRSAIDALDDEAFARVPEGGGWSVAQICDHLGRVSDMLLGNAEKCAGGDGETRGFQLQPALICAVGSFPPVRMKVPPLPPELQHMGRPEPVSKAGALARLDGIAERMRAMRDDMTAAPKHVRREHPTGGWMHAGQWFQINEMHLRHHLRQLRRTV